jgi:hypothetical protein
MRANADHQCDECGADAQSASRRFLGRAALYAGATAIAVSLSACYGGPPRPPPAESPTPATSPVPSASDTVTT